MQSIGRIQNECAIIEYKEIAKKRRELENILMILEDFKDQGIEVPKDILIRLLYEPERTGPANEDPCKNEQGWNGYGCFYACRYF